MKSKDQKTALALAAAALFVTLPTGCSQDTGVFSFDKRGKCIGGNTCKGQSDCATATTSCNGLNDCKGQGFIMATKAACDEAGGEWEAV